MDKYNEFDIDSNKTSGHLNPKIWERQTHMIEREHCQDKKMELQLDKDIKYYIIPSVK